MSPDLKRQAEDLLIAYQGAYTLRTSRVLNPGGTVVPLVSGNPRRHGWLMSCTMGGTNTNRIAPDPGVTSVIGISVSNGTFLRFQWLLDGAIVFVPWYWFSNGTTDSIYVVEFLVN